MIEVLVTIVHLLTCVFLILVILLQSGKGGGVSAAFGGGASAALGQRAAATALGKATTVGAVIFLVTSMLLAWFSSPDANDPTKAAMKEAAAYNTPAPTLDAAKPEETKTEEPAQDEPQANPLEVRQGDLEIKAGEGIEVRTVTPEANPADNAAPAVNPEPAANPEPAEAPKTEAAE